MGIATGISYVDHTVSFWFGCEAVSPACAHCFAKEFVTRRMGLDVFGPATTTPRHRAKRAWAEVPRWNRAAERDGVRRRVLVESLGDIFEDHPQLSAWRAEALALLDACKALDVLLLTKRPENVLRMVPPSWRVSWPEHVQVGTTVEDQPCANKRIPELLRVPARLYLSMEPLLSPVDLTKIPCARWLDGEGAQWYDCLRGASYWSNGDHGCHGPAVAQIICGGESGAKARPFNLSWARALFNQVRELYTPPDRRRNSVAWWSKQVGDNPVCSRCGNSGAVTGGFEDEALDCPDCEGKAEGGRLVIPGHHGADPAHWPSWFRVQELPKRAP